MLRTSLALLLSVALATTAAAQHSGMKNMGMAHDGMDKGLMDSMTRMNKDMPKKSAGGVDADFVKMMIPHHQAAIDMAKVQLAKGTDPEIRKLSEEIIAAQQKEIAQMKDWLGKHGVK